MHVFLCFDLLRLLCKNGLRRNKKLAAQDLAREAKENKQKVCRSLLQLRHAGSFGEVLPERKWQGQPQTDVDLLSAVQKRGIQRYYVKQRATAKA